MKLFSMKKLHLYSEVFSWESSLIFVSNYLSHCVTSVALIQGPEVLCKNSLIEKPWENHLRVEVPGSLSTHRSGRVLPEAQHKSLYSRKLDKDLVKVVLVMRIIGS